MQTYFNVIRSKRLSAMSSESTKHCVSMSVNYFANYSSISSMHFFIKDKDMLNKSGTNPHRVGP